VADVPGGLSLTPPEETKLTKLIFNLFPYFPYLSFVLAYHRGNLICNTNRMTTLG
jgi:hypothetical protein